MAETLAPTTTLALKEWGAVVHALLDGRQTVLLRKGGIHERAFAVGSDRFLLFPTVAHSHAERTRPGHHDLLAAGVADAPEDAVTIRAGVLLVDVVPVARPDALEALEPFHIWTTASVRRDRVDFRPKHRLQALVVQTVALDEPITLPRRPEYRGCTSWIDVYTGWEGDGAPVHELEALHEVAGRVRAAVG